MKKLKRFFLNSEKKYNTTELILNWFVWISLILMFIFGLIYSIETKDIKVDTTTRALTKPISQVASDFVIIAFGFFLVFLVSFSLKIIQIFKRKKRNKNKKVTYEKY